MNNLTPQIIQDRAVGARVSLSRVLKRATVSGPMFYKWRSGKTKAPTALTLAKIEDALIEFEVMRETALSEREKCNA